MRTGQVSSQLVSMPLIARSQPRELAIDQAREPPVLLSRLKIREHIIGERVSAMIAETVMAPTRVKANCVNKAPVSPVWNAIGAYAATSTTVMARIGPPSSRAPWIAESKGVDPSFMCRSMFSTTMMASSTTRPIASTSASSVNRLIE